MFVWELLVDHGWMPSCPFVACRGVVLLLFLAQVVDSTVEIS